MNPEEVKAFYENDGVVLHYATAVNRVGLWNSEELLLTRLFRPDQKLLEIGCGAGRIAFGLHNLGYRNLTAVDYSPDMIGIARNIAAEKSISLDLRVGDATQLEFSDESFDGAIFGFNGLMQIPSQARRQGALEEIFRVIKPNGFFFFTTHDRDNPRHRKHWKKDQKQWKSGNQRPEYEDFGDRIGDTEWGEMYIHIPTKEEMIERLTAAGFRLLSCQSRCLVALESKETRQFSDECLMWVVKKPAQ
jgi:ubiquinone/menaquinone biosynthesis C-methylase UbiE